jgi:hypothetical protein
MVYMNPRRITSSLQLIVVISIIALFTSCGGGGHTGHSSTGTANSEGITFYGSYNVKATVGTCDNKSFVFEIGTDSTKADVNYLYIPESASNSFSYEFVSEVGEGCYVIRTVTISNNKIIMDDSLVYNEANSTTKRFVFTFADDYNSFSLGGTLLETDPTKCEGIVSGTGTRK